jgi:hypothetical protein
MFFPFTHVENSRYEERVYRYPVSQKIIRDLSGVGRNPPMRRSTFSSSSSHSPSLSKNPNKLIPLFQMTFKKHASSLHKLHTASFNIRNIRLAHRHIIIDIELITAIMKHGPPLLRRLSVNGQSWEVRHPFSLHHTHQI